MKIRILMTALLFAVTNAFCQVPSYVPTNGLVGWWPFNGNANDESGNGNNGTVNGATLTSDRFGNSNSSFDFNGSNNFIEVQHNSTLNFTNAVSFSFWLNSPDYSLGTGNYPERNPMGIQRTASQSGLQFETVDNIGTCCGAQFYLGSSNGIVQYENSIAMPINSWVHLVGTYDGSVLKLYQNGVLLGSSNNSILLTELTQSLFIGKEGALGRYFKGKIDDVGIWNRALTPQEITALYSSQQINTCSGGSILQNDTSVCLGSSVTLQAISNSSSISSCFAPSVKVNGNLNFNITSTTADFSGNVFHAGAYSGNVTIGTTALSGIGGRDFFLVKYDSCGNQQWVIRGGSTGNEDYVGGDFGKGISCDASGNVYLVGRYNQTCTVYGTGGTSFTAPYTVVGGNSNHQDGFLVKISPAGEILWGATIRGSSNDGINGVTVDPSGNPIVSAGFNGCCPSSFAGTIYGTTNTLNISSFGSNYGTGALVKFNSSGTVQWAARVYNRDASCGALTCDVDGNVYVTGSFRSWSNGTAAAVYDGLNNAYSLNNPGIGLGYLLKLSPLGAYIWGTTFGNTGDGVNSLTYGTGLDLDSNGDVWVAGYYSGAAPTFYSVTGSNLSGPASTGNRGFVAKYNSAGQALLTNTLQQTASNNTQFYSLACNGNEVRVVGNYAGSNLGLGDIIIANYNLNAVQQNVQTAGGSGEDWTYDIRKYKGGYLIAGSVASGASIGVASFNSDASYLWNTTGGVSTPTVSYLWSNGATTSSIAVSPTQTTTYYCTISNGTNSCIDSIKITINSLNTNLFSQDTIAACGTSYTLDAGSGYNTYLWSNNSTTQTINVTSTGWYSCSVNQGSCNITDSVFVSLLNATILNNDTILCSGATVQLTAVGNCSGSVGGNPQWQLLIPGTSYTSSEINFNPNGFNQATQTWYSVLKNGSINKVYAFNLANNNVLSLTSNNAPGELYSYAYDRTNNRIVASRVGRDVVYALPISGGSWQQIGSGGFDAESYGSNAFWNPVSNRFSYFGGYGFYSTKNWIWENNNTGWINTYANNNNCNLARRVGNGIAPNSTGTKQYIFSGQGSCNGDQFASSCSLGSPWPTDVGVYCWLKDIWELDLSTYQFTNVLPVNNQSITREGAFSFDHSNNAFYLIGGRAPTSTYAVYTPYSMDVSRFRKGIDSGFSNIAVGGIAPPADRDGSSVYDAIGNRIIYARTDGVWALNLGSSCNLSYQWSNGATTPTISVTPTQTTTYYCTVSNGITSCVDSVVVIVNNLSGNLFTQDTIAACGTSYALDAGAGYSTYSWSTGSTSQTATITSTGWYKCTITQSLCTSIDSVFVSLLDASILNNDTTICNGTTIILNTIGTNNVTNSNAVYNSGNPNPWPYPSPVDGGYIPLGTFGTPTVFSLSCFINPSNVQNSIAIIMDCNHGGNFNWVIQNYPNISSGSNWSFGALQFVLSPNSWQHLLITYDNGQKKAYVNGVLQASVQENINWSGNPGLFLGNWPEGGRRFQGGIDELYITYDLQYSSNFNPPNRVLNTSTNTFGLWHFDEGQGLLTEKSNGSNYSLNSWSWSNRDVVSTASCNWSNGATTSTISVTPTQTTTYYCTISNGISSCTDSVTVTVNSTSTSIDSVIACDSYQWNGITYTSSGNYTYSANCQDYTLNLTITNSTVYYQDQDFDGYGSNTITINTCNGAPVGYIADAGDCNDNNTNINPGASEICGNGIDDNCDGNMDEGCGCFNPPTAFAGSDTSLCAGNNISLNGTIGGGASNAVWSTSGSGTFVPAANVLNATYVPSANDISSGAVTLTLTTNANAPCNVAVSSKNVTINPLPLSSGLISGLTEICYPLNNIFTYSINPVPGATSYTWSVPPGTVIQGSATGTSIQVKFINDNVHASIVGSITVTANNSNGCGSSTPSSLTLQVHISAPIQPCTISGPVSACNGIVGIYSVAPVFRAISYNWTVPTGATIINGAGSNIITVQYGAGFTGGTISVSATNICGTGAPRTRTVTRNVLTAPKSINGPVEGLCNATSATYSIPPVNGANSYNWTLPLGATIISGVGSNAITVEFNNSFTSGSITVAAVNACGVGLARSIMVKAVPGIPTSINGPVTSCVNSNKSYSTPPVVGALSYTWTVPNNAIINSGQGTKNINITYGSLASSTGIITVKAINSCGASSVRVLSVKTTNCPRAGNSSGFVVNLFPNPTSGILNIESNELINRIELFDMLGKLVMTYGNERQIDISNLQSGLYLLRFTSENGVELRRVEVSR
jgi:hypothetical protein